MEATHRTSWTPRVGREPGGHQASMGKSLKDQLMEWSQDMEEGKIHSV